MPRIHSRLPSRLELKSDWIKHICPIWSVVGSAGGSNMEISNCSGKAGSWREKCSAFELELSLCTPGYLCCSAH